MCINPRLIKNSHGRFFPVPCGKCPMCLHKKQSSWYLRSVQEAQYFLNHPDKDRQTMTFFTFTYDDEHLPIRYEVDENGEEIRHYPSLNYPDVNKMIRTLKMHNRVKGLSYEWSYIFCGEHGTLKGRPHYHMLAYGFSPADINFLVDWWLEHYCPKAKELQDKGIYDREQLGVYVARCDFTPDDYKRVSHYVTKYCSKGGYDTWKQDRPLSRPRVFTTNGFGSKYLEFWAKQVNLPAFGRYKYMDIERLANRLRYSHGFVPLAGKVCYSRLPNYFLDRIKKLQKRTYQESHTIFKPYKFYFNGKEITKRKFNQLSKEPHFIPFLTCDYLPKIEKVSRIYDERDNASFVSLDGLNDPYTMVTKDKCSLRSAFVSYLQKSYEFGYTNDLLRYYGAEYDTTCLAEIRDFDSRLQHDLCRISSELDDKYRLFYGYEKDGQ